MSNPAFTSAQLIRILEKAKTYQTRHPKLFFGYMVGLTVLDDSLAKLYARVLEGHNPLDKDSTKLPGAINQTRYQEMRQHYTRVDDSLLALLGSSFDAKDPRTLDVLLRKLRGNG